MCFGLHSLPPAVLTLGLHYWRCTRRTPFSSYCFPYVFGAHPGADFLCFCVAASGCNPLYLRPSARVHPGGWGARLMGPAPELSAALKCIPWTEQSLVVTRGTWLRPSLAIPWGRVYANHGGFGQCKLAARRRAWVDKALVCVSRKQSPRLARSQKRRAAEVLTGSYSLAPF